MRTSSISSGARVAVLLLVCAIGATTAFGEAVGETPGAAARPDYWRADAQNLPFSFVYGNRPSAECLAAWPARDETRPLDKVRTQRTRTWTDPQTGLEVRWTGVEYANYPVVEWTVYFGQTGKEPTPILERLQAFDSRLEREEGDEFVLHGNKGDWCVAESYEPYQLTLASGARKRFAPAGGRPTNGPEGWPYFNLQRPGGGLILAVGWPGQWACEFLRDQERGLRVMAGQESTHFSLKPGEQVRTPLVALLFWQGAEVTRAQNLWRRWFMEHNLPRLSGVPVPPMAHMQLAPNLGGSEEESWRELRKFEAAGVKLDLYWHDAGWYPCRTNWVNTGTWEFDPQRFPRGLKPVSDWIHAHGKKLIVWFEPERVGDESSWLAKNHPEWLLGGVLLNLGNPDAWSWTVEQIDRLLRENGIDHYRQDFNMDPLNPWRASDAPDRQGIAENLHVQGYLAFWDELRRRHPGLLIDSCASGGRRNDLETLRRAVPLLRSDFQPANTWEAQHAQTYGLSAWVPYYGSGVYATGKYQARSYYMPCFGLGGNQDMAPVSALYEEWAKIAPFMLGDFHPLTPYTRQLDRWIAWQFNRPESGDGLVQAFRHDKNVEPAQTWRLRDLDPAARYEVSNLDTPEKRVWSGRELLDKGLTVDIPQAPGAALILYRRLDR